MHPTILVPFDFGPDSRKALAWAADLQRTAGGAPVHVLHVLAFPAVVPPGMAVPTLSPRDIEEVEQVVREAVHENEICANVEVVVSTSVSQAILDAAHRIKADLIAMGTHGRHGMARLVLGSVAERIAREATCPVVTMRATLERRIRPRQAA